MQTAAINKDNSPQTPILAQLGRLEKNIGTIWDRTEKLESRLIGVLAYEPSIPQKESPASPKPPMSPIQAHIDVFNDKTEMILRKMAELIDRLEV